MQSDHLVSFYSQTSFCEPIIFFSKGFKILLIVVFFLSLLSLFFSIKKRWVVRSSIFSSLSSGSFIVLIFSPLITNGWDGCPKPLEKFYPKILVDRISRVAYILKPTEKLPYAPFINDWLYPEDKACEDKIECYIEKEKDFFSNKKFRVQVLDRYSDYQTFLEKRLSK